MRISLYGKNKYLDKIVSDSQFRLFLTAAFSGGWNYVYATFLFVLAGLYQSFWFVTLGAYYFFLGTMRGALVAHGKRPSDKRSAAKVVGHIGVAFFFLAIVFVGTVVLSILERHTEGYGTIIMITIATYTFYLLVMAIIGGVKAGKQGDIKIIALRNISLGGAIVSLFSLEKSMLLSFGTNVTTLTFWMEVCTGAGVFLLLLLLGINLIVAAKHFSQRV